MENLYIILDELNISKDEYFNKFKLIISGIQFKEVERNDTNAKVVISGYFKYDFDNDFLYRFMKEYYSQTGDVLSEPEYERLFNNFRTIWKDSDKEINSTEIRLVKEDGKWFVCDGMLLELQRIY